MEAQVLRRSRRPQPAGQIAADAFRSRRRGFTLVEMLVAMALTLIMVYAIAEFYAYVGDTVRDGRAMIEMGGQLRATTQRLKADLDSLTVRVVPWTDDGNNSGYFEYREGGASDLYPQGTSGDAATSTNYQNNNSTNLLGDLDDFLAMTIRSDSTPFVSPNNSIRVTINGSQQTPTQFTSRDAEVIWWTGFADTSGDGIWQNFEPRFLYRRELIVAPHLNEVDSTSGSTVPHLVGALVSGDTMYDFHQKYDISARPGPVINGVQTFIANSLSDLARRENRFAHVWGSANYPNAWDLDPAKLFGDSTRGRDDASNAQSLYRWILGGERKGEDVMLSNVLAFDVRAYDQNAPVYVDSTGSVAVAPGDVTYPIGTTASAYGAYVDLNYNSYITTAQSSVFSGPASGTIGNTYDTWALSYERNSPGNGQAMNGVDDNNNGVIDDASERVTNPPYDIALRGAQVKIRVYDTSSRQVRQATVTANFAKE